MSRLNLPFKKKVYYVDLLHITDRTTKESIIYKSSLLWELISICFLTVYVYSFNLIINEDELAYSTANNFLKYSTMVFISGRSLG